MRLGKALQIIFGTRLLMCLKGSWLIWRVLSRNGDQDCSRDPLTREAAEEEGQSMVDVMRQIFETNGVAVRWFPKHRMQTTWNWQLHASLIIHPEAFGILRND